MTFSLSYLTELPQTLILMEVALWLRLWCWMTPFLTITSPPGAPRAPSPFRQNIVKRFHGGAGLLGPPQPCSARHSCLPAHLPSTARAAAGSQPVLTGSHCPVPSSLGWAADTGPPYLSYVISHWWISQDHLGEGGKLGWAVSVPIVQRREAQRQAHLFVLSTSIFHGRCGTSRDQHKKVTIWFSLTVPF